MTYDELSPEEKEAIGAEAGQLAEDAEKVRRYEHLADVMRKVDEHNAEFKRHYCTRPDLAEDCEEENIGDC